MFYTHHRYLQEFTISKFTMASNLLKIHPSDNVIVALRDLPTGTDAEWSGVHYNLPYGVSAKHKFVTEDIETGGAIIMYGVLVGRAKQPIKRGEPITTFNLKHDSQDYSAARRQPYSYIQPDVSKWQNRTFKGYHRADGRVGTYNYWLVVPLVFCENRNVLIMKDAFERELGYAQTDIYREHVREFLHLYQAGDMRTLKSLETFTEQPVVKNK